jgi:hypothetical protein
VCGIYISTTNGNWIQVTVMLTVFWLQSQCYGSEMSTYKWESPKNFLMIHLCWSSCKLNLLQEINYELMLLAWHSFSGCLIVMHTDCTSSAKFLSSLKSLWRMVLVTYKTYKCRNKAQKHNVFVPSQFVNFPTGSTWLIPRPTVWTYF